MRAKQVLQKRKELFSGTKKDLTGGEGDGFPGGGRERGSFITTHLMDDETDPEKGRSYLLEVTPLEVT